MSLRQVALHEAAHAVVSAHYGLRVVEVRVSASNGETRREQGGTAAEQAAITAAGEVGQRLAGAGYVDLACDDLADFEQRFGLGGLWWAQKEAREILTARRDAFDALAARLERERSITFNREHG